MNFTGNKSFLILALTASASTFAADAPELVTFSANTPAKAEEVNANFADLKTYGEESAEEIRQAIEVLRARLNTLDGEDSEETAGKAGEFEAALDALDERLDTLEASQPDDEYSIKVWGDCDGDCVENNLIGYAKTPKQLMSSTLLVKTNYGLVQIKTNNNQFELMEFDWARASDRDQTPSPRYLDSSCDQPVHIVSAGDGQPVIYASASGQIYIDTVIPTKNNNGDRQIFTLEQGIEVNKSQTLFYQFSEGECSEMEYSYPVGTYSIPMTEIQDLKATYNTIKIEGYTQL